MKYSQACYTIILLLLHAVLLNAQSLNNRFLPDDADLSIMSVSEFGDLKIYSLIDNSNKDSITSKNYIANSDTFFEIAVIRRNRRKYYAATAEHSPLDNYVDYRKNVNYEYHIKKGTFKPAFNGFSIPGYTVCIGFSPDFNWNEELQFSKALTEEIRLHLIKALIISGGVDVKSKT